QDGPIAHHVRVTLDLDRGRHAVGKAAKVGLTSGAVELLAPRELGLDRDRVDPLAALEERLRRGVDALVPREVEVVHAQQVCDLEDRVAVGEQAAEDVLLGGFVERDPPVGRGGSLERHLEIIEHPFHSGKQKPTGTSKKPRFGKLAGTKVSCGISPRHGDDVHRLLHQFRPPRMHRCPVRWTKRLPHSIESAWSCVSSYPAAPDASVVTSSTRSSRAAIASSSSTISRPAIGPTSTPPRTFGSRTSLTRRRSSALLPDSGGTRPCTAPPRRRSSSPWRRRSSTNASSWKGRETC